MEKINKILYGADYNPEQWKNNSEILREDIRMMKKAGCNVMSIGIFAWSEFEKKEGVYDFSFYDYIFDEFEKNGIKAILATPSAAKPAWMTKKYPEILITGADRKKRLHGMRLNHCYTSPIYRKKVHQINEALANHFGNSPALLGWHVSNEYCGECHCELCQKEFRKWLKEKYHTLDNLNEQWWTSFWSHTYTDWSEIESPSPCGEDSIHGLRLDWQRFVTYQTIEFYKNEIEPLRRITPDKFVTTNFYSMLGRIDYWKMKDYIDIASWDIYPDWDGQRSNFDIAVEAGFTYDLCRSLKKAPFLLMESTPSTVNWREVAKLKEEGTNTIASIQAIAHGANSVQYFQWRKNRGGYEKFHGAVVDHNGRDDTRVFKDVEELGQKLHGLGEITSSNTYSKAAVIFDFENMWALREAKGFQNNNKKYTEECMKHYSFFLINNIETDVINQEQDFSCYSIVAAPMLYLLKEDTAKRLKEFVKNGGILISGFMSGYVNENDLCYLGGFPGAGLMEWFGIWNEEIDTLYEGTSKNVLFNEKQYEAVDYCEHLHLNGAESVGTFTDGMFKDKSAVTVNKYGKGKAYYIAFRSNEDFLYNMYSEILNIKQNACDGIYQRIRENEDKIYKFIFNWGDCECAVKNQEGFYNLENGCKIPKTITIDSKSVLILAKDKRK